MRYRKALIGLGLLCAAMLGTVWNAGYEATPDGATALASDIDTFFQTLKADVRKRAQVERIWGNGTDDNGLQQPGSARSFIQNAAPTDILGLGQYNSSADATAGTALSTDEIGATTRDLGVGRLWSDLDGPDNTAATPDDRMLATWDETNDRWVYQEAANSGVALASQRFFDPVGKSNLLYNGDFEATDGTGATSGSTATNWATVATAPTISFTRPPSGTTEGDGVQVNLARGAGDGGIEQTVVLKSDATYFVVARTRASGGASCELSTASAGGNLAAQTTARMAVEWIISGASRPLPVKASASRSASRNETTPPAKVVTVVRTMARR